MLIRLTPFGTPGGPQRTPKALCGKDLDAKMVNIVHLDYSANFHFECDQWYGFLVACKQLYKPLCWSVGPLVGPSVAGSSEHATYGDWPCFCIS